VITNAETIINGKRMIVKGTPQYIEVARPSDDLGKFLREGYREADMLRPAAVTIRTERHRLVRLVAEYELDSVR
jgi:hypothetical protein